MKKYLSVFFYDTMEPVFLYKDTGSITLALAKYYKWKTTFAYLNVCGNIQDSNYEKYVELKPIEYKKNKFLKWINIIKFIWQSAEKYDVLNFYFGGRQELLLGLIAKIKNPKIKVYIKMDLVKEKYLRQINENNKLYIQLFQTLSNCLANVVDLYTVECRKYIFELNKIKRFKGKIKYLPNGFFNDLVQIDENVPKEKIILTVGRLGAPPKNTQMLVRAIENIDELKLKNWKVYLVGPITDGFKTWLEERMNFKPYLKNVFVITGNINDKNDLYTLYARSSVFVLTSIYESWALVLTEAIGFGCYPIVTNCCDAFDEILDIKDNGFAKIIENKNVEELQCAIEDVINNKVDYLSKGKIAKKFAESNLEWKNICALLNDYFTEILKGT